MSTAPRPASTVRSTATEVRARGWQSGIRSGVRLAPMIPASRATDSTSTFLTPPPRRSEEHTSELQHLMRITYAVLCLNKKTTKLNNIATIERQHTSNYSTTQNTTT